MERDEFRRWADDLSTRLPSLAKYVLELSTSARAVWFDDIFANFELRDALAMNQELMASGEGLSTYERDKLPSLFIRTMSGIVARRQYREEERRVHRGARRTVMIDAIMGPMLRQVTDQVRDYKRDHDGELPSDELVREWTAAAHEQFDRMPDDDQAGPRYSCLRCKDTGYVEFESASVRYVASCPDCEAGKKKRDQVWRSGRHLFFPPADEALNNPFDEALR
jgi:hypothetical protein